MGVSRSLSSELGLHRSSTSHLRLVAFRVLLASGDAVGGREGTSCVVLKKTGEPGLAQVVAAWGHRLWCSGFVSTDVGDVVRQLVRKRPKVAHSSGRRSRPHGCRLGGGRLYGLEVRLQCSARTKQKSPVWRWLAEYWCARLL
jgi:hypothetical protein